LAKITNADLFSKMGILTEKMDNLSEMLKDDIKPAVRKNTEFRLRFKGMVAVISGIAASVSAGMILVANKLFK